MGDYFLSGSYTSKQFSAINRIKNNDTQTSEKEIKGNLNSFVNDVNNYVKGEKTTTKKVTKNGK